MFLFFFFFSCENAAVLLFFKRVFSALLKNLRVMKIPSHPPPHFLKLAFFFHFTLCWIHFGRTEKGLCFFLHSRSKLGSSSTRGSGEKRLVVVVVVVVLGERRRRRQQPSSPRLVRQPFDQARPPPAPAPLRRQRRSKSPPVRHHDHAPPRARQRGVQQPPGQHGPRCAVEHKDDGGGLAALGLVHGGRPGRLELGELGESRVADDAAGVVVVVVVFVVVDDVFFFLKRGSREKERKKETVSFFFFVRQEKKERKESCKKKTRTLTNSPSVEGNCARVVGQLDARDSPVVSCCLGKERE